ncbi:MAG: hypothetical protein K2X11_00485 [Acetobacteraceae bacterium]|nr:hypothetical protein [Acetobacteraceae bacterium]
MSCSAFFRSVDVFVSRDLSDAERARALAEAAEEGTRELIAAGRASPRFTREVDGVEGRPATSVRPDGVIVDRFSHLAEVIVFALAFLRERSPQRTGRFRSSFFLGISTQRGTDGRFVPAERFNPAALGPEVEELIISNEEPYARKVDVQLVGGRRLRFSVPAGLYEDAARQVKRRFGNFVDCYRRYTVRFPGQYVLREGQKAGKPVESRALVISLRR